MNMSFSRLSAVVALTLSWCSSGFAHSAVEPVPRPDDWWKTRHASMNEKAAALGEKAQVIFIGDSITQGWEGEGKEVWARYYAGRNAINLGIGGDRTQHVLWRLENGNIAGLKPKAAVLMIGTNNSNGEDNTVEQVADGVSAIVKMIREKLPATRILLVPIFPRNENPSVIRGKVLQVNQVLQKLVDETNVFWADFGFRFVNADGTIPRELMPDYLHLSPKAYGIWADSIESRLASILGDSPIKADAGGAASGAASNPLSGGWTLTIPGPNQEPVDLALTLKQEGAKLSGKVERPNGGAIELEKGEVRGNDFTFVLKRNRSDGSVMTYDIAGKLDGGKLAGKASTQMDGNPVTIPWTAKRR